MINTLKVDFDYIQKEISDCNLENTNILITGCAGFLGYYLTKFLVEYINDLKINSIIGLDTFLLGYPQWINEINKEENPKVKIINFNIGKDKIVDIKNAENITHVIHMASIASPSFYRKYPLETVDANVWGLRDLLNFYSENKSLKGFLFFSSSEIYGDPDVNNIPTQEEYRGFVSCTGPRACYDEAKRFGETLCCIFRKEHNLPITIVRPFNNYGPGMRIEDKRLPADLAKCIIENKPITLFSDGSPTRTFCYVADAISGYLKALNSGNQSEYNIGIDLEETSVYDFANFYKEIGQELFGYNQKIKFNISEDKKYLTDNPQRRCPNITKARRELNYQPKITIKEGIKRYLYHLKNS